MRAYIASRVVSALLVVLVAASLVFFLIRLSGDPVQMMLAESSGVEQARALRHALGLDRPLAAQYLGFLGNALRGDFGRSFRYDQPALSLVLERMPATLELALGSLTAASCAAPSAVNRSPYGQEIRHSAGSANR